MRKAFAAAVAISALISALAVFARSDDMVRLAGNHPVEAQRNTAVGNLDASRVLAMEVRFAPRNRAALGKLLADQQDSGSLHYHQWLKTGEFDRRFGPRPSDIAAVEKWLKGEGFVIDSSRDSGINFHGTAAQAERTFSVKLLKFGDGSIYGHLEDPLIPQSLARVIGNILGLDNMMSAQPMTPNRRPIPGKAAAPTSMREAARSFQMASESGRNSNVVGEAIINNQESFGPGDLRTFYDETPLINAGKTGSGECIAIVGTSDFLDSAVTLFNNHFGLPASSITRILVDGSNPGKNGAEGEAHLDLEWSHVTAPGAPTNFYLGDPAVGFVQALVHAISQAASDNTCAAISISFALCGASASFYHNTLDQLFAKAASQGQSVFVSSGDQGAAGIVFDSVKKQCVVASSRNVNEMSADPNVSSIGGISFNPTFDQSGNDVGSVAERVWDDPNDGVSGGGAGGGGASAVFAKPAYQTGTGVPNDSTRDTPDVSLIASPNFPGVFVGDDDGSGNAVFAQFGGTSLSAPVWAGIVKMLDQVSGQRQGNLNPTIYQLANQNLSGNGFRDVTSGNNNFNGVTGFSAGTGFDLATGWGTVDIATFIKAVATSPTPTPTPTATASGPTPTMTATATATAITTPSAAPTPATVPAPLIITVPGLRNGMVNFGIVKIGKFGRRVFTLRNPNKTHTPITFQPTLARTSPPPPNGEFGFFQSVPPTCHQVLPAKGHCIVTVFFVPTTKVNNPQTATLQFFDNANNPQQQTFTLQGIGK